MDTATIAPSQDAGNAPPDPDEPVVDATIVEEHPATHVTTDLAVREIRNEVIRPLDRGEVVEAMREHQLLLRDILDASDWQGEPDKKGSFVKKSGWRKVALAYNLTLEPVSELVERDEHGVPRRATSTWRAVAPNGRSLAASGHCSYDESRFSGPKGNTSKLENDLRTTAETRAKNRAISDLIGMGKVSAEEVDAGASGPVTQQVKLASDDLSTRAKDALRVLLGEEDARATYRLIVKACQHGPDVKGLTHDAATAVEVFAAAAADLVDGEPTS